MSSNNSNMIMGQTKATNALKPFPVGFEPTSILVENHSNNCKLEWRATMDPGTAVKTIADGTRSIVSSAGITVTAASGNTLAGFTVGAVTDINDTTTEDLHWVAQR